MQSHDDRDYRPPSQMISQLMRRAQELSDAKANEITAGRDGEQVLFDKTVGKVLVRRLPDDSLGVLRISIGGEGAAGDDGSYLVYRGDPNEIERLLKRAWKAMRRSMGHEEVP